MPYLLDTDVISAILRRQPHLGVVRRLAQVPTTEQFTSAVSFSELLFGAHRRDRDDLLALLDQVAEVLPVLPFDEAAARISGRLKADLERTGMPLAEPDLRIASIAVATGLTLVTGNVRHFERVPNLLIENWLT